MDAIVVDNVSKRFRIPHEKKGTLFQNLVGRLTRQMDYEEFWALRDVSFGVGRGKALGIIGRNGSGKTTLLKVLAGVLYSDSGSVKINGRIASFLELGVGFQPELSASENVYIYSCILGVSRREVKRNYESIFDFAELKRFESMKLKNFSSGMYLRLAFATAIHADPDILLIDEVLAVGDEAFQKKCSDRMADLRKQGKTIILVSHSLGDVKSICDRALLMQDGRVVSAGETETVIDQYLTTV